MGNASARPRTLSLDNDAPGAPKQPATVQKVESTFNPNGDTKAQLDAALSPLKRRLSRDAASGLPSQFANLESCIKKNTSTGLVCLDQANQFVQAILAAP